MNRHKIPFGELTGGNVKGISAIITISPLLAMLLAINLIKVSDPYMITVILVVLVISVIAVSAFTVTRIYIRDHFMDDKERKFAMKYSDTFWHPITPEELNEIFDKYNQETDFKKIALMIFLIAVDAALLAVFTRDFPSVVFISIFSVSAICIVVHFIRDIKFSRSLVSADICYMPVYLKYHTVHTNRNSTIYKYHAIAFYGQRKYIYSISEEEMNCTDIMVINTGNISRIRPVYIEKHQFGKRDTVQPNLISDVK